MLGMQRLCKDQTRARRWCVKKKQGRLIEGEDVVGACARDWICCGCRLSNHASVFVKGGGGLVQ